MWAMRYARDDAGGLVNNVLDISLAEVRVKWPETK